MQGLWTSWNCVHVVLLVEDIERPTTTCSFRCGLNLFCKHIVSFYSIYIVLIMKVTNQCGIFCTLFFNKHGSSPYASSLLPPNNSLCILHVSTFQAMLSYSWIKNFSSSLNPSSIKSGGELKWSNKEKECLPSLPPLRSLTSYNFCIS